MMDFLSQIPKVESFKGSSNIYFVFAKSSAGKLGINLSMMGSTKKGATVGVMMRFAVTSAPGCAVETAPFGSRGTQNFTTMDGKYVPGVLLGRYFMPLFEGRAPSVEEVVNKMKNIDFVEKIVENINDSLAGGEYTSIDGALKQVAEMFVDELAASIVEDGYEPTFPKFNKPSNVITMGTVKTKGEKPGYEDDED